MRNNKLNDRTHVVCVCVPLTVVTTSNCASQCGSKIKKKCEKRGKTRIWSLDSRWRLTKNSAFAFHARKRHAQKSISQQSHTDEIDFAGWIHLKSCCLSLSSLPVPNNADSIVFVNIIARTHSPCEKCRSDLRKTDVAEVSKANCPTMFACLCAVHDAIQLSNERYHSESAHIRMDCCVRRPINYRTRSECLSAHSRNEQNYTRRSRSAHTLNLFDIHTRHSNCNHFVICINLRANKWVGTRKKNIIKTHSHTQLIVCCSMSCFFFSPRFTCFVWFVWFVRFVYACNQYLPLHSYLLTITIWMVSLPRKWCWAPASARTVHVCTNTHRKKGRYACLHTLMPFNEFNVWICAICNRRRYVHWILCISNMTCAKETEKKKWQNRTRKKSDGRNIPYILFKIKSAIIVHVLHTIYYHCVV